MAFDFVDRGSLTFGFLKIMAFWSMFVHDVIFLVRKVITNAYLFLKALIYFKSRESSLTQAILKDCSSFTLPCSFACHGQ